MKTLNYMVQDKEVILTGKNSFYKIFNEPDFVKRDFEIMNFESDNELLVTKIERTINPDCVKVHFITL